MSSKWGHNAFCVPHKWKQKNRLEHRKELLSSVKPSNEKFLVKKQFHCLFQTNFLNISSGISSCSETSNLKVFVDYFFVNFCQYQRNKNVLNTTTCTYKTICAGSALKAGATHLIHLLPSDLLKLNQHQLGLIIFTPKGRKREVLPSHRLCVHSGPPSLFSY